MDDLSLYRTILEIELEEKIQERIQIMDEWADGIYSFDEAKEKDQMLAQEIADLQAALNQ